MCTPEQLARAIGTTGPYVRYFLRDRYPNKAPGKGGRWHLTLPMIVATVRYFG